jgi:hypothetical protein
MPHEVLRYKGLEGKTFSELELDDAPEPSIPKGIC